MNLLANFLMSALVTTLIIVGALGIGLGAAGLLSAKTATGPVLGLGLTYANGQLTGAQVLGQTKDMAGCRELATKALAAVPAPEGVKVGCAQVEIQ